MQQRWIDVGIGRFGEDHLHTCQLLLAEEPHEAYELLETKIHGSAEKIGPFPRPLNGQKQNMSDMIYRVKGFTIGIAIKHNKTTVYQWHHMLQLLIFPSLNL